MLVKVVLSRQPEPCPEIVEAILFFSLHFPENEVVWETPPHRWLVWSENHITSLAQRLLASKDNPHHLGAGMDLLSVNSELCTFPILATLYEIWSETSCSEVKRVVVPFLILRRRQLGDTVFFQALPLLSSPQRRLLDAYMSLGS